MNRLGDVKEVEKSGVEQNQQNGGKDF